MDRPIDWTRLWRRIGGPAPYPEAEPQQLSHFASISCLLLLGQPGSGKTTELEQAYRSLEGSGEVSSFIRLRQVTSGSHFASLLSADRQRWMTGTPGWTIFLDGLDELPARDATLRSDVVDVLSALAEDAKGKPEAQPVRLIITCRSSDLPEDFVRGIEAAWASEVALLQIEPLTREDVLRAASDAVEEDRNRFAAYLDAGRLWPLASSPMTLDMLLRLHVVHATGSPTSLAQTYRAAISDMLEGSRIAMPADVDASALARSLLGRLAVVCMLSNKMALWTGVARDGVPPDAVAIADLAGIGNGMNDTPRLSDEVFVRSVIASGFFLRDGPNRWAWPHQSFAEFLAADCLAQTQLDRDRVLNLLSVREASGSRIAPQLREVAAWLAGIDGIARRILVEKEPVLLLRSDVAAADDVFKAALVSELLARSEAGQLEDFTLDRRVRLGQLWHPDLATTLTPWIADKRRRPNSRRIAIEIARSCGLQEVGPSLLRLATDADEPLHLRATATVAAGEVLTDPGDLARLRPLVESGPDSDPQDELRGAALWVLWPKFIGPSALFSALLPPKDDTHYGWYKAAIYRLRPSEFTAEAVRAGLAWLNNLDERPQAVIAFHKLGPDLLRAAWEKHGEPEVLAGLTDVLVAAADDYRHVLRRFDLTAFRGEYVKAAPAERRQLVGSLAARAGHDASSLARWTLWGPVPLLWPGDLPWLLEWSGQMQSDFLVDAICAVAAGKSPEELPELWQHEMSTDVAKAIERLFVTNLDAPAAGWAREAHRRAQAAAKAGEQADHHAQTLVELAEACAENPEEWWKLNLVMLSDRSGYGNELSGNLAATDAWLKATAFLKAKLLRCAYRYLVDYRMSDTAWVGTDTILRTATAGYRALRLLFSEMRSLYDDVPDEAWAHWAPAVLWFPNNDPSEERVVQSEIAAKAREKAPTSFVDAVGAILERSKSPYNLAALLQHCFDEELGLLVWEALLRGRFDASSSRNLFELLVEHRHPEALGWTKELLLSAGPVPESERTEDSLQVFGPAVVFEALPVESWGALWTRCQLDPLHALAIWRTVAASNFFDASFLAALPPAAIGNLLEWLKQAHPGPHVPMSGYVSPDDQLFHLQSRLPGLLAAAGDHGADILSRLAALHPDDLTLNASLAEAREIRLRTSTAWMTPAEVLSAMGLSSNMGPSSVRQSIEAAAVVSADQDTRGEGGGVSARDPADRVPLEELTKALVRNRRPRAFLFLSTEWSTKFGGISSLNRGLAAALARDGHRVTCLVPEATVEAIGSAKADGVKLVGVAPMTGYKGRDLLDACRQPQVDVPDYVVGHDHVTGRGALRIRDTFFPNAGYIHVLHTIPSESERYKDNRIVHPVARGLSKDEEQRCMCTASDVLVAVGPRIFEHLETLHGGERIHQLIPGLDQELMGLQRGSPAPRAARVLWMGRAEDRHLKGLPAMMHMAHLLQDVKVDGIRYPKVVIRGLAQEALAEEISKLSDIVKVEMRTIDWQPYTTERLDIVRDYQSASCFVLPSMFDAFGLVAFDAIAAGLPAIVSSMSGVGRLLLERQAVGRGIGLPPDTVLDVYDDPADTARKWHGAVIRRLNDPIAAFAEAAYLRDRLRGEITWETCVSKLVDFLAAVR